MNTQRVDYINMGLLVLSLIFAVKFPFELFLMAYAILGPLHYLTEIGWLHQRNYFSKGKKDWWILVGLCSLVCFSMAISEFSKWERTAEFMADWKAGSAGFIPYIINKGSTAFIFMAFAAALGFAFFDNKYVRYGIIPLSLIPAYLFRHSEPYMLVFAVFLPTVIHVSIFTGLFMLFGALKSRSIPGIAGFFLMIGCILLIFNMNFQPKQFLHYMDQSDYWMKSYKSTNFDAVNYYLWDLLAPASDKNFFLNSKWGLRIQAFIAFIYTYHYLNWFSKTEIIKWHAVSKKWLLTTVVLWIVSVALYAYDYKTGLLALFFLSMLHVFLEFPLNYQSILGIGKETLSLTRKKKIA